ncbi:MAG: Fe-S cluster assembly protein SufD [Candidatus Omnitrophica bacterium]|nr:Fe-S cluster assembly protein SufD [Candidatus Omnitrophota bacterium]
MMNLEKKREALNGAGVFKKNPNAPAWLGEIREKAYARYQSLGLPTKKMDLWKYTNLEKLLKTPFGEISDSGEVLKFNAKKLLSGVILGNLSHAIEYHAGKIKPFLGLAAGEEENSFALINSFSFQEGVFLYVPANVVLSEPVELIFSGRGEEAKAPVFCPRILIVLEDGAKANVTMLQTSVNSESYFCNAVAEVFLGKNAELHWVQADRESKNAFQFFTARIQLQRESRFEMITFTSGGNVTRQDTEIVFQGEGASAWVGGLALLFGNSEAGQIVTARHQVSNCTSRQLFKNILAGHSQAEFTSLVHVGKGTHQSDSNQLNRNLILSDFAHAYSRPQLKIDADDVKASHGSATGQPDPNELFYLQSRGLSPETARLILSYGFSEEVLEKMQDKALKAELEKYVHENLALLFQKRAAG